MHYNTFLIQLISVNISFQLINKDFLGKIDTVLQKTAKDLLWLSLTTEFQYAHACSRNTKHRAIIFIHNFLLEMLVAPSLYFF